MRFIHTLLLLGLSAVASAGNDLVIRDFDIGVTQEECRSTAIRIFRSLATDDVPVMELQHIVFYESGANELAAVCRADKGLLVLFAKGPLMEAAHVRFHEAFGL
jgi:hypothetical protein